MNKNKNYNKKEMRNVELNNKWTKYNNKLMNINKEKQLIIKI